MAAWATLAPCSDAGARGALVIYRGFEDEGVGDADTDADVESAGGWEAREAAAHEARIRAHAARVARECPLAQGDERVRMRRERREMARHILVLMRGEPLAWYRPRAFVALLDETDRRVRTVLRLLERAGYIVCRGDRREWYWRLTGKGRRGYLPRHLSSDDEKDKANEKRGAA